MFNTLLMGEYISLTTSFSLISQGFINHVCVCRLYVFYFILIVCIFALLLILCLFFLCMYALLYMCFLLCYFIL